MLKSINDVLFRSSNFKVTLSLFVDSESENNKFKRSKLVKVYKNKLTDKPESIYLDTFSRSIIGFCAVKPGSQENAQQPGDCIYFSQKSFHDLVIALDICISWLRSKNFKFLFDIDSDGIVKGLGGPAPYHPSVYKNQSEFIRFFPAVVKDFNGIKYEGISLRLQRGPLAQFTCMEFFVMASAVKNYLSTCYCSNLQLINIGLHILRKNKAK